MDYETLIEISPSGKPKPTNKHLLNEWLKNNAGKQVKAVYSVIPEKSTRRNKLIALYNVEIIPRAIESLREIGYSWDKEETDLFLKTLSPVTRSGKTVRDLCEEEIMQFIIDVQIELFENLYLRLDIYKQLTP